MLNQFSPLIMFLRRVFGRPATRLVGGGLFGLVVLMGCGNGDDDFQAVPATQPETIEVEATEPVSKIPEPIEKDSSEIARAVAGEAEDMDPASRASSHDTQASPAERPTATPLDPSWESFSQFVGRRPPAPSLPDTYSQSTQADSSMKEPDSERILTPEQQVAMMRARIFGAAPTAKKEEEEPREIKLLIPDKKFERDEKVGALRVTFDDIDLLKILNMERVQVDAEEYLPDWLTALDGQKIVIRGWMYPTFRETGIHRFLFVRDNGTCCFGPNAKIYDKIGVTLQGEDETNFIYGRPFDVTGTFIIETVLIGDDIELLYHIEDAQVLK